MGALCLSEIGEEDENGEDEKNEEAKGKWIDDEEDKDQDGRWTITNDDVKISALVK